MNANSLIQYFTLIWVDNPHKKRISTWGQFTKQTKYPRSKLSIRASGLNESLKLSIRHGEIENSMFFVNVVHVSQNHDRCN